MIDIKEGKCIVHCHTTNINDNGPGRGSFVDREYDFELFGSLDSVLCVCVGYTVST